MAGKKSGPNRSAFIRDVLKVNKDATIADVNQAWKDAGHRGDLNPALYYQMRSKTGLGGRKQKRQRRKSAEAPAGDGSDARQAYLRIEQQLDSLIGNAGELKDNRLADALRDARRRASAKLL